MGEVDCAEGEIPGSHGFYGARTEQFAFASILYNVTRGVELYEGMEAEVLDMLRDFVLPELAPSPLNDLTKKCWRGGFATLADLVVAVSTLEGAAGAAEAKVLDEEYMDTMKATCRQLLEDKLSDAQFENADKLLSGATPTRPWLAPE